jgi:D-alanyl-D-alanine carboxypeptidase
LATQSASAFDPVTAANVFARLSAAPALNHPSVSLIDVRTGEVVFEANANVPSKPASLMKLLSASATLKYLDPAKTFTTSISLGTKPNTLVINGDYDPWISMKSVEALKMHRTSFYGLATASYNAIHKKSGKKVKKISIYYNDLYPNEVVNFKLYYKKRGVRATMIKVSEPKAQSLTSEEVIHSASPNVEVMMNWFLTWSDNIVAERMARLAAMAAGNQFNDKGVAKTFQIVLTKLGIDPSKIIIKDASGLSKENKVTASTISQLLYKIHSDPQLTKLIDGLPISGKTGTLQKRYVETAPQAVGLVKAKTGTLSGTIGLAGYVQSGDREYAFVVIADKIKPTYSASELARKSLDTYLSKIATPLMLVANESVTAVIG